MAPVHPSDTYSDNKLLVRTRAGNAEASSVMTERMKETVSLWASALLLTVSAVSVASDAVNERAVAQLQYPGGMMVEASDAGQTNETRTPNVSRATSRWYGQNPFMVASAAIARSQLASAPEVASDVHRASVLAATGRAERAPAAQASVAQAPAARASVAQAPAARASVAQAPAARASVAQAPAARASVAQASGAALPSRQDTESLAGRIQWLNQVTLRVMDELDVVHPPPLKKLIAQVTNSGLAGELEGAGKVFGNVTSDLKEGFVGLVGTMESISRGEDSGIHLPEHVSADKGSPASASSAAIVADAAQERGDP